MSGFNVRVELHSATYQDYENLHGAMARAGFSRQILSDGGKTYQLPTAEYIKSADLTRIQVLNQAKAAANSTGKSSQTYLKFSDQAT
ncbi:MAG: hypothetical protein ABSB35_32350 [Bryobacteraceae bacterium]|jgi:hypothetical protein